MAKEREDLLMQGYTPDEINPEDKPSFFTSKTQAQVDAASRMRANMSIARSAGMTADNEAKVFSTAARTGVPAATVRQLPSHYLDPNQPNPLDLATRAPATAEFLAVSPTNAAIGSSDWLSLQKIEGYRTALVAEQKRADAEAPSKVPLGIGDAYAQGKRTVGLAEAYYQNYFLGNATHMEWAAQQEKENEAYAERDQNTSGLRYILNSAAEMVPNMVAGATAGIEGGLAAGTAAAGTALIAGQFGPQVAFPEEFGTMPAAALAGFMVGGSTGMASQVFRIEAGLAAHDLAQIRDLNDKPIDPSIVRAAAVGIGAINSGLELVGWSKLAGTIPKNWLSSTFGRKAMSAALVDPEVAQAIKAISVKYGEAVVGESATEMAQEVSGILGSYIATHASEMLDGNSFGKADKELFTSQNIDQVFTAGKKAAAAALVFGAPGTAIAVHQEIGRVKDAKTFTSFLQGTNQAVNDSPMQARSPEKMREFLQLAGHGGEAFIDPDTAQKLRPDILAKIGVTPDTVAESDITGQSIPVRLEDLHTKLTKEEFAQVLPGVKAGQKLPSENQGKDFKSAAELARAAETYDAATLEEVQFKQSLKNLRKDIVSAVEASPQLREQIRAQGVTAGDFADTNLKIWEGMSRRLALEGRELNETLRKVTVGAVSQTPQMRGKGRVLSQPLSEESKTYVSTLTPEQQTALAPSIQYLEENPDPNGDLGNLQMVVGLMGGKTMEQRDGATVLDAPQSLNHAALVKQWRKAHGDRTPVASDKDWQDLVTKSDAVDAAKKRTLNQPSAGMEPLGDGWAVGYRIGMTDGTRPSRNSAENRNEPGVSMLRAVTDAADTHDKGGWFHSGGLHFYRGKILSKTGSDGEPLFEVGTLTPITRREFIVRARATAETETLPKSLHTIKRDGGTVTVWTGSELRKFDGSVDDLLGGEISAQFNESAKHEVGTVFGKTWTPESPLSFPLREKIARLWLRADDAVETLRDKSDAVDAAKKRTLNQGPLWKYKTQEVLAKLPKKAPSEQIRNTLMNNGVNERELFWLGIDDLLKSQEVVSKAEIEALLADPKLKMDETVKSDEKFKFTDAAKAKVWLADQIGVGVDEFVAKYPNATDDDHINFANKELGKLNGDGGDSKFSTYVLPGGEDYRELLIMMAGDPPPLMGTVEGYTKLYRERFPMSEQSDETIAGYWRDGHALPNVGASSSARNVIYSSSHWSEKNVLLHTRFNERTDSTGTKVLHIEEIQSDWHQAGREKGYAGDLKTKIDAIDARINQIHESSDSMTQEQRQSFDYAEFDALKKERESLLEDNDPVPSAPFAKTWEEIGLKRMIRQAAEQGLTRITWTTGEQQAERYDLGKQVDQIRYKKNDDGTFDVWAANADGGALSSEVDKQGLNQQQIADFIGKEMAQKIVGGAGESIDGEMVLKGVDLKVGGEGMKAAYDQRLVSIANKIGKKYGVRVADAYLDDPTKMLANDSKQHAAAIGADPVHSLDITPDMAKDAMQGMQALFQGQDNDAAGEANANTHIIGDAEAYIVNVFKGANLSSLLHESAHVYLSELSELVGSGTASTAMVKDWDIVTKWLGVDLLSPKLTEAQYRDAHEQFARGFEEYLREGKAPSPELADAFERFKQWLLKIYKTAQALGPDRVPLTDEVRQTFGRLISTKEEVRQSIAENELVVRTDSDLNKLGLGPEEKAKINELLEHARVKTEQSLQRRRDSGSRARTKEWRAEATREILAAPVYQAMGTIKKGGGLRAVAVSYNYGDDTVRALRERGLIASKNEDGLQADAVAAEHGFEDSDAMILALLEAQPTREAAVQQYIEQQQAAYDATHSVEESLTDAKEYADYMEEMGRYLGRILKEPTTVSQEAFRTIAENRVKNMPMSEAIKSDGALAAMQLALRAERRAMAKGDFKAALKANDRARLNFEMAKIAKQMRKMYERTVAAGNKAANADKGTIEEQHHLNLVAALQRYGLLKGEPKIDLSKRKPLNEVIKTTDTEAADPTGLFPDVMMNEVGQNWAGMSANEFEQLSNMLKYLAGRGRALVKDEVAFSDLTRTQIADEVTAPIAKLGDKSIISPDSYFGKLIRGARAYYASLDQFLFVMRRADGSTNVGKDGVAGPNERLIYRPLAAAWSTKKVLSDQVKALASPHIVQLRKSMLAAPKYLTQTGVAFPELLKKKSKSWTFEQVVAVALNMGNEYNRQAVLDGYGMTEQDLNALTSVLSTEDWAAIQGLWSAIDSLWPQIDAVHYRLNHFHQDKVAAAPFINGKGQRLEGGYYPVKFDSELSATVGEWTEADNFMNSTHALFPSPAVAKGFTKSRSGTGGKPINLSIRVLGEHLDFATQYITHAEIVKDMDRIMSAKVGSETNPYYSLIAQKLGDDVAKLIRPTLKHIARPEGEILEWVDKILNASKGMATAYILGLNVKTALTNLTGITTILSEAGAATAFRGYAHVLKDPRGAYLEMTKMSPYMASRAQIYDRDVRRQLDDLSLDNRLIPGATREGVKASAFILLWATDLAMVMPSWWGVYQKNLAANGGDTQAAVTVADEFVASTNPSARPIDLAQLQRSNKGLHRLFTMFSSFTIKYGNRQRLYYSAWKNGHLSGLEYMKHVVLEAVMPSLMTTVGYSLLWGHEPDDEKDLRHSVADLAIYQFQGLPFFRDVIGAGISFATGDFVRDPTKSPVFTGLDLAGKMGSSLYKFAEDMDDDAKMEKAAWAFADMVSFKVGLPVPKLARNILEGVRQYNEEDTATLFNLVIPDPAAREKK